MSIISKLLFDIFGNKPIVDQYDKHRIQTLHHQHMTNTTKTAFLSWKLN